MKKLFIYIAALIMVSASWCSADTIILKNGYELYGKASAHPVFPKTHTIIKYKNGGISTLRNSQIIAIVPNSKDHFEERNSEKKGESEG